MASDTLFVIIIEPDMRIKLKVSSPQETLDGRKYIINVNTERMREVADVIAHIRQMLELEGDRIQLLHEDCHIPPKQSSDILLPDEVYTCRVMLEEQRKRPREKQRAVDPQPTKKRKVEQTQKSVPPKKKVVKSSSSSSSADSSLSESSDSSSEKKPVKNTEYLARKKEQLASTFKKAAAKPQPSETSTQVHKQVKQPKQLPKPTKKESDDDTPPVTKPIPKEEVLPKRPQKPIPIIKPKQLTQKAVPQKVVPQPEKAVPQKRVLELNSDSDSSKQQGKPKPASLQFVPKSSIPIAVRKQQFKAQQKDESKKIESQNNRPLAFEHKSQPPQPPRAPHTPSQKISKLFSPQQGPISDQWIEVPVRIFESTRKDHKKSFLTVDQKIMFQTTELLEQKFELRISDWKVAEVESLGQDNEDVVLVTQPRREKERLREYNIMGLKVKLEGLNDFQKRMIREVSLFGHNQQTGTTGNQEAEQKQVPTIQQPAQQSANVSAVEQPSASTVLPTPKPQSKPPVKQQTPVRDLILSQVDYYFSDRNYNRDDYLISHAALHPQLYISAAVILNFPKLKSRNLSEADFMNYLREGTQPNSSYELHPTENKLRKKGLRIDPPKEQVLEAGQLGS